MEAALTGRCGMFDHDWVKDIVALAPGESLDLHTWIPDPSRVLALDEVGTIRIRMHYTSMLSKGTPGGGVGPHPMSGLAPFEIVSNPVAITVASPLALRATLPLPVARIESVTLAPGESLDLVGPRARFSRTSGR